MLTDPSKIIVHGIWMKNVSTENVFDSEELTGNQSQYNAHKLIHILLVTQYSINFHRMQSSKWCDTNLNTVHKWQIFYLTKTLVTLQMQLTEDDENNNKQIYLK